MPDFEILRAYILLDTEKTAEYEEALGSLKQLQGSGAGGSAARPSRPASSASPPSSPLGSTSGSVNTASNARLISALFQLENAVENLTKKLTSRAESRLARGRRRVADDPAPVTPSTLRDFSRPTPLDLRSRVLQNVEASRRSRRPRSSNDINLGLDIKDILRNTVARGFSLSDGEIAQLSQDLPARLVRSVNARAASIISKSPFIGPAPFIGPRQAPPFIGPALPPPPPRPATDFAQRFLPRSGSRAFTQSPSALARRFSRSLSVDLERLRRGFISGRAGATVAQSISGRGLSFAGLKTLSGAISSSSTASSASAALGIQVGSMTAGAATAGAALIGLAGVVGTVAGLISGANIALTSQENRIAFGAILGSDSLAKETLSALKQVAKDTPLTYLELQKQTPLLIASGSSPKVIGETALALANIKAGLPQADFSKVLTNIGQIEAAGNAYTRDLREFATQGIPIYEGLQAVVDAQERETGDRSSVGLKDRNFSAAEVREAILELGLTGRFAGAAEKVQQGSVRQQFRQASEDFSLAFADFIESFDVEIVAIMSGARLAVEAFTNSLAIASAPAKLVNGTLKDLYASGQALFGVETARELEVRNRVDSFDQQVRKITGAGPRDTNLRKASDRLFLSSREKEVRSLSELLTQATVNARFGDSNEDRQFAVQLGDRLQDEIRSVAGQRERTQLNSLVFGSSEAEKLFTTFEPTQSLVDGQKAIEDAITAGNVIRQNFFELIREATKENRAFYENFNGAIGESVESIIESLDLDSNDPPATPLLQGN